MAKANITNLGVTAAVALEEAALPAPQDEEVTLPAPQEAAPETPVAPNVSERRVVGRQEFKTPQGQIIVVENL